MSRVSACLVAFLAASVLSAAADTPVLRGVGVEETLAGEPVLAAALDAGRLSSAEFPLFVRLVIGAEEVTAPGGGLDARLALYASRRIPVVLTIADPPLEQAAIDGWRAPLRAFLERNRGRVAGYQVGDVLPTPRPAPAAYAYLVKFLAVQARSIQQDALIVQAALPPDAIGWQEDLYKEDVAAYVDAVSLWAADAGRDLAAHRAAMRSLVALAAREDPAAVVGSTGVALPSAQVLAWHLFGVGERGTFTAIASQKAGATPTEEPGSRKAPAAPVEDLAGVLKAATALEDVLGGELVSLEESGSPLRLLRDTVDLTAVLPHRLLYNTTTFATYLACWPDPGTSGRIEVSVHLANPGMPAARDLATGRATRLAGGSHDEAAKRFRVAFDVSAGRPVLVDFNFGAEEALALRTGAAERALPRVEEIISRHQQAEAAQQARYHNYTADAIVNLHFRPTATDSGYDVVLENRFFWDPEAAEWEEHGFVLNGTRWGRNRPPFPMLQPEKVLSLPLSLRFTRDYAYHLDGVEALDGRRCFVVRFDPVSPAQSLYRGRVWIDAERFTKVKVQAVQTMLKPPVVSNEEIQTFQPVEAPGGGTVSLFATLESKQIMLLAGRNVLVEKQVRFSGFRLDDPAFAEKRGRARAGDNVMYRDTDRGLRYLVKRGGERVVSDTQTRTAKAFIMGASIDPSYDYPVPMGGLDYLDFDFLHKDLQFALIFGGVLALGNVQKARIAGSRFDINVDFFAIALSGNDQVFDEVGERKGERLRTRPASAGINVGFQATDFQKITGSVHVQHDAYMSAPDMTAAGFEKPVNGVTVNTGMGYEYRRGGYSLAASYSFARRGTWRKWGFADQPFDPSTRTYAKYSLSLNKEIFLDPLNRLRVNAAFYGGQRQDRFSMYRFGLFDETRMRGVPSAGVRFSEMAMQRAQYSFNLLDLYRLDLFYDHAWGRTAEAAGWSGITGIGTEVSFRGPRTTMIKAGVGKGYLPRVYRGSGSWVVEFTILKPL